MTVTRPKSRTEDPGTGSRTARVVRAVASALIVMLTIALAAACSPTTPETTARGRVTLYQPPT